MSTTRIIKIDNPSPKLLELIEKMKVRKEEKKKELQKEFDIYFPKK